MGEKMGDVNSVVFDVEYLESREVEELTYSSVPRGSMGPENTMSSVSNEAEHWAGITRKTSIVHGCLVATR